jgi:hypothetical protein
MTEKKLMRNAEQGKKTKLKWVFHHLNMKYSSKDIDEELYKKRIINFEGLRFQYHVGKGEQA